MVCLYVQNRAVLSTDLTQGVFAKQAGQGRWLVVPLQQQMAGQPPDTSSSSPAPPAQPSRPPGRACAAAASPAGMA